MLLQAHLPPGGDVDPVLAVVAEECDRLAQDGLERRRAGPDGRPGWRTHLLRDTDAVLNRALQHGGARAAARRCRRCRRTAPAARRGDRGADRAAAAALRAGRAAPSSRSSPRRHAGERDRGRCASCRRSRPNRRAGAARPGRADAAPTGSPSSPSAAVGAAGRGPAARAVRPVRAGPGVVARAALLSQTLFSGTATMSTVDIAAAAADRRRRALGRASTPTGCWSPATGWPPGWTGCWRSWPRC